MEVGTIDAERCIDVVLPIALKSGNKMLGNNWTYQQDGATRHTRHLPQKWCADHFSAFISKDRWPLNSTDLSPLDYNLWNGTKAIMIEEIKHSVKKIKKEKILDSALNFTVPLRLIQKDREDYIR
jgi:hypothetical protein